MSIRRAPILSFLLIVAASAAVQGQAVAPRRATTAEALLAYPGFYQGQLVVVRGILSSTGRVATLASPSSDRTIPVIFGGTSPADGPVEVRATFWDIGRLQREDPRLQAHDLLRLLPNNGQGDWPRPGELVALVATDAIAVQPATTAPNLRTIALEPLKYEGQRVTVTGQFRGRNLFGDVAQAPGVSQWEFVLHNGDAAVWVTGERPRGKGFNLDVGARLDTRTWLKVTGTVHRGRGLVWIEATPPLELATPETTFVIEPPRPPEIGPAPEVVFSDPEDGDSDVPLKHAIRIQFSRDMNPDSFTGNVKWGYAASDARQDLPLSKLTVKYDKSNRSIEVKIDADDALKYHGVEIALTDAITATDGAKLKPWTMRFTYGQ